MPLEQLTLSDEQVQDIVASLITSGDNADAAYDDTNDTLTVSLSDSISVNTLEAESATFNQDITDPEGNTVTSLSDPVRVTEEAVTFSETSITVAQNKTNISDESIELGLATSTLDDFESGDLVVEATDWGGWQTTSATLTAQQSTVISGSYSGRLESPGDFGLTDIIRSSAIEIPRVDVDFRPGTKNNISADYYELRLGVSAPTDRFIEISFNQGSGEIDVNGNVTGQSWSGSTTYSISVRNIDYTNETFDVYLDGGLLASNESFSNSASGLGFIQFVNNTSDSGDTLSLFIDNLISYEDPATSGDALISFDNGSPSDIESWDLTTFQRTLDGETVTIDVEDSNGTVLKSDISKDTDISDVATSTDVQLRANLSRNDTANNPTVDYLARRFSR